MEKIKKNQEVAPSFGVVLEANASELTQGSVGNFPEINYRFKFN